MFDHVTLRVVDLANASRAVAAVLDELEIEQTTNQSPHWLSLTCA